MSELGELDRPGRPNSPGAWDTRSEEWLVAGFGGAGDTTDGAGDTAGGAGVAFDGVSGVSGVRGVRGVGVARDAVRGVSGVGVARDAVSGMRGESAVGGAGAVGQVGKVGQVGLEGSRLGGVGGTGAVGVVGQVGLEGSRLGGVGGVGAVGAVGRVGLEGSRAGGARRSSGRRGAADPVKALMHRHRELCERAVDPLEIAAGLEAHGVTDRTAARFRHRDVFSLAEEMYARVARDGEPTPPPTESGAPGPSARWAALALLPGALCAAAVSGLRLTDGQPRLAVAAAGVLAVALGLRAALRSGPLSAPNRTTTSTRTWTCWLLAYALFGDGLLSAGLADGPQDFWPSATAPVLALALACAPAAWCARLFAVRARRRLTASRGLEEFAESVRPLVFGVFALFLCAMATLLALCGAVLDEPAAYAGAGSLGALLLLARLLTVHGFSHAPAVVLGAASMAEAAALGAVFAGRLPGCSLLATPVDTLVAAWGPGAVPAVACGSAALVLLIHSTRSLTRASAHATPSGATP